MLRPVFLRLAAAAALALAGAAAPAQVTTIDPNTAVEQPAPPNDAGRARLGGGGDEYQPVDAGSAGRRRAGDPARTAPAASSEGRRPGRRRASAPAPPPGGTTSPARTCSAPPRACSARAPKGSPDLIEDMLRDQGEPSAYIAGQEAGGAFIAGVRYGSGTMHHQIEGDRPVYWTGPSIGFDFGADANKVFVLVYNLHDSQQLFRRYPAAEGNAYVVGGFTASYMRRGDVVLIPVRLGVGARLGINAGYMRFSEKNRWLPF